WTPVTPEDFVWTFSLIMDERVAAARDRSGFEKVKSVEKGGSNEVVFRFKEPFYDVMAQAASVYALPKHFYSKYTPEQFNTSGGLLLGSGPYRLEDSAGWKPGTGKVDQFRNEKYWGLATAFNDGVYKDLS